jgi:hypothetical protein
MKEVYLVMALSLLASAACNKSSKPIAATKAHQGMVMVTDTGPTAPRSTGGDGMGMMLMMQAHVDSMIRMSPDRMSGMMARHEQMMSQMMDQMGAEMRQMRMPETPGWSALTDSVKQDLAELPSLRGQALSDRMQAHAERVRRLIAMHKRMSMGM